MKVSVKYGIYIGIASAIWMYLEYVLGFHRSAIGQFTGFLAVVLLILGVFFSIKTTRDRENSGVISMKDAIKSGTISSLVASIIIAVSTFIYYQFVNPGFIEYWIPLIEKQLREKQVNENDIRAKITTLKDVYKPLSQTYKSFLATLMIGTVTSMLFSFFLKRHSTHDSSGSIS